MALGLPGHPNYSTIDTGLSVRFPVNNSLMSRLLRVHKILKYPRVSHCSLCLFNNIYDLSLNRGFLVGEYSEWEQQISKEYVVDLPLNTAEDTSTLFKTARCSTNSLFCHSYIKEVLASTVQYRSIGDRTINHPIDLLWTLVEDYNGTLRTVVR